jgi:threonine/homoserine/homoserine lactone efflux protein
LFFLAVFAGMGLPSASINKLSALPLVVGVFLGSGLWWLILSGLSYKLKQRLNKRLLKRIDLFSGISLLFFCVILIINLIKVQGE